MEDKNEKEAKKAFKQYKDDFLKRAFERDFAQIVRLHKDKILAFRKRWDIPTEGLASEKSFPDWTDRVLKKYKGRARSIKNFEIEYYYGIEGFILKDCSPSVLHEEAPRIVEMGGNLQRVFGYEVYKLSKKLTLNPEWGRVLEYYLLYDKTRPDLIVNTGVVVSERITYGENGETLDHRVSLIFGPKTRRKEIEKLWQFAINPLLRDITKGWEGKTRKGEVRDELLETLKKKRKGFDKQAAERDMNSWKEGYQRDISVILETMDEEEIENLYEGLSKKEMVEIERKLAKKLQNLRYRLKEKSQSS